jgi:hypothetical protein
MAGKTKGDKKQPSTKRQQREAARAKFLSELGDASASAIGRQLGVHRTTVMRWIKDGGWEAEVEEIRQRADKEVTASISTTVASKTTRLVELSLKGLEGASKLAIQKMFKHDSAGRMVLDEIGNAVPNDNLKAAEINMLMSTHAQCIKACRLVEGASTANVAIRASVDGPSGTGPLQQAETSLAGSSNFQKKMDEISSTGNREAQEDLMTLAETFSRLDE